MYKTWMFMLQKLKTSKNMYRDMYALKNTNMYP